MATKAEPKPKPLSKSAQQVVDIARGAYEAQPWLVKAQDEFGPKQAAAEAATAAARASGEAAGVASGYQSYYNSLMSSGEYKQAAGQFSDRMASSNKIFGMLDKQAADELALGGQLTGDEQREVGQATRAAWSDRGLATSGRSAIDEVLNRVAASNARKDARRAFAGQTAAQGTAIATQNMNVAASQFDPYQRMYGTGGSDVTGTLGTDQLFSTYAGPMTDIYGADKSYAAAMAQIGSAEKMQKLGFKNDLAMTKLNAGYAQNIANTNASAARSAGTQGMWGSIIGGGLTGLGILGL
jgi:hypothetical protein